MKQCLLSFFLLLLITAAMAQSGTTISATASATIVHPVGAYGVEEEPLTQGRFYVAADVKPFPAPVQASAHPVASFGVASNSFVYTVGVLPYVTENNDLRKVEQANLLPIEVKTRKAATPDTFVLNASFQDLKQPLPLQKRLPDVAIHFN